MPCLTFNRVTLGDDCSLAAKVSLLALPCVVLGLLCSPCYAQAPDPCFGHADGALCNDNNACTLNDVCRAGWCRGSVAPNGSECTDGNLCTDMDRCTMGLCIGRTVPDGNRCDDGNLCTVGELCRSGFCQPHGNLQCNDGPACTSGLCIPSEGCVYRSLSMCPIGSGGHDGRGWDGGGGGPGGGGGGGANESDAGDDAGAAWDVRSDSGSAAGTNEAGAGPPGGDRDAANASVDAPQVVYIVEGGAWLCTYRPGRKRSSPPLPLLAGVALALCIGVRRNRTRLQYHRRMPARRLSSATSRFSARRTSAVSITAVRHDTPR